MISMNILLMFDTVFISRQPINNLNNYVIQDRFLYSIINSINMFIRGLVSVNQNPVTKITTSHLFYVVYTYER